MPRYPHLWWLGHHQVRGLAQWYWNNSRYFVGEPCTPGQGQIPQPAPHPCLWSTSSWKKLGEHRDILYLKVCNANIHTYTSHFMENSKKDNEILAAYAHHFKREAKRCDFNSYTATIHIFIKGLWDVHNIVGKVYKKDPQRLANWWRSSTWLSSLQLLLCKAVLSFTCYFVLYIFICMSRGFAHYFFIWYTELTQLCSSSGSLFFALWNIGGITHWKL